MKHPERIEDYLDHIAQAIQRATEYIEYGAAGDFRPEGVALSCLEVREEPLADVRL